MKKKNKFAVFVGATLFSTMILSGISTPVKADNVDTNSLLASQENSTMEKNTTESQVSENIKQDSQQNVQQTVQAVAETPNTPVSDEKPNTGAITIYYKDQTGDIVQNNDGTNYAQTFTDMKSGDVIGTTDLTPPENYSFTDKNGGETNPTVTIDDNATDYYVDVLGKSISGVQLNIYTPEDHGGNGSYYTVKKSFSESHHLGDYYDINDALTQDDNPIQYHYSGAGDMLNHFLGYTFEKINPYDEKETKTAIFDESGKMLKLTGIGYSNFAQIALLYGEPTSELPVLVKFQDVEGNEIKPDDENFKVGHETYQVKNIAPKIAGYTFSIDMTNYYMATEPIYPVNNPEDLRPSFTYHAESSTYVPTWNDGKFAFGSGVHTYGLDKLNEIVFIYTKDDKQYNYINYVDQKSGETIYSYVSKDAIESKDELPTLESFVETADASIKDYSELGLPTKKNNIWTIPVVKYQVKNNENLIINNLKIPYVVNGEFEDPREYGDYKIDAGSNISFDLEGQNQEYSISELFDEVSKVIGDNPDATTLEKLNTINDFIEKNGRDFQITTITYNLKYNLTGDSQNEESKNLVINFKTADGQLVKKLSLGTITGSDSVPEDISEYLKEIPVNYQLVSSRPSSVKNDETTSTITLGFEIKSTKEPGNGGSSSSKPTNPSIDISENISVHPTISQTKFYDDNGNVLDKDLLNKSDYHADKKKTINGTTYYRIATNTWVKGDDVYIYHDQPTYVRTYLDSYKFLANSQNKKITNRALQAGSDWYSDRYAYFNDEKYYRVSTNEWVKADDAFEYDPINKIVTTTGNQVFDETGNVVRSLDAGIVLRTDKIATINGVKMYRVATNEWIN